MNREQLWDQMLVLREQAEKKFQLWDAMCKAARFYSVLEGNRDDAMHDKLYADADKVWQEYQTINAEKQAVREQWQAVAFLSDVTDSEVPAGDDGSVTEKHSSIPAPVYPGQYTTWGMNKRAGRFWHWNQLIFRQIEGIVDVAFKVNEERAASWREQIVEDEIKRDGAA